MNTGTGVWTLVAALGALIVSAAGSKNAEARPSYTKLAAYKPQVELSVKTNPSAPSVPSAPVVTPTESAPTTAVTPAQAVEVVTPPHLLENLKLRRMQKAEISPAMLAKAADIVRRHHAKPVGTEITVEIEGKRVVARIERHFHPEGGPVKPWGFHPGVSLFIAR